MLSFSRNVHVRGNLEFPLQLQSDALCQALCDGCIHSPEGILQALTPSPFPVLLCRLPFCPLLFPLPMAGGALSGISRDTQSPPVLGEHTAPGHPELLLLAGVSPLCSLCALSCLYGTERVLGMGHENDSVSVLPIILCCKLLFQIFHIITRKTKIRTNATIYSQTKLWFS